MVLLSCDAASWLVVTAGLLTTGGGPWEQDMEVWMVFTTEGWVGLVEVTAAVGTTTGPGTEPRPAI